MTGARKWILLLALVSVTVGCDRVTKHLAVTHLAGTPARSFLAGTVRVIYAENAGAFLGLGAGWPRWARAAAFIVGTTVVLAGAVVAAIRLRWTGAPLVGVALVFAGGVSNLIDRLARGSTVDFMDVGLGSLRTGIFNVADVAIMAGVTLLMFGYRHPSPHSE